MKLIRFIKRIGIKFYLYNLIGVSLSIGVHFGEAIGDYYMEYDIYFIKWNFVMDIYIKNESL